MIEEGGSGTYSFSACLRICKLASVLFGMVSAVLDVLSCLPAQSAVGQADEMIVTAGEYLIQTLKTSTAAYRDAAQHKVKQSIGVATGFATAWAAVHWRRFAGQGSA